MRDTNSINSIQNLIFNLKKVRAKFQQLFVLEIGVSIIHFFFFFISNNSKYEYECLMFVKSLSLSTFVVANISVYVM